MASEKSAGVGNRVIREPSEFRGPVQVYWTDGKKTKVVSAREAAERVNTGEYVRINDHSIILTLKTDKDLLKVRIIFNRRNCHAYIYQGKELISSYWGITSVVKNLSNGKWLVKNNGISVGQVVEYAAIEEEWR